MRRPKVLVVDDEPAILHSTGLLLREMGFEVVTLDRAADIVATAAELRPDLLLQDVRMPGLDLREMLQALREDPRTRHVPVLLFSAGMDLDHVAHEVGASRTLEKPFKPHDLAKAIRAAIG